MMVSSVPFLQGSGDSMMRPTLLLLAAMGLLLFVLSSGCDSSGQKRKVETANDKPQTDSKSEAMTDECLGDQRTWKDISFSPDGKKIAFTSLFLGDFTERENQDDLDTDICVINADGTGMVRLTDDPGIDMFPTWSPDGRHLALIRGLPERMDDPVVADHLASTVVIMDADGSYEKELPGTKHKQPDDAMWNNRQEHIRPLDWSPSGEEIAFSSASCDIYIKPADSSGAARKLSRNPDWGCTRDPEWSPDGKRLAFSGDFGIYVRNLSEDRSDTDQVRRVAGGRGGYYYAPAWSPDGTEIVFFDNGQLHKVNVGGSGETDLGASGWSPNWLPDGKHIAYLGLDSFTTWSVYAYHNRVYEVSADGSHRTIVDHLPKGARWVEPRPEG
jgi:Tol biopolymer transport system component